ncbi:MAG: DUF86 domain-containing protein [Lachnospiraceae bacterium]|nr:DUF86 domain-containing protein [Lachnospiraceae bacterium]
MDNIKNDGYYITKIKGDLQFIFRHMDRVETEEFSQSEILQDSMMFRLIQISENARRLSEQYKKEHASIPWTAIYGLRNKIVHDYGNVDLGIVYSTLKEDIPALLKEMVDL